MRVNFPIKDDRCTVTDSSTCWQGEPHVHDCGIEESYWNSSQIGIINGFNTGEDGQEKPDEAGS